MQSLPTHKITALVTNILNKLSPLLLFVLIVILCWYLASFLWLLIAPTQSVSLSPVSLSTTETKSTISSDSFNIFESPKVEAPVATMPLPVQPNNLKLEGVMVALPEYNSSAIISDAGNSKRYRIAEKIGNSGYTLNEVHWKKVVLTDNGGSTVELKLYEEFDLNAAKNLSTDNQDSSNPMSGNESQSAFVNALANNTPELPPPFPVKSPKPKPSIKEQVNTMLEKASGELKSNPASYLNKMGVMAVGDGYLVTDSMNSQIRSNIGLQEGDKVISVNGQPLGQPQTDAILLDEVKRTGSAEIQVQRGSQVITIRQQF